MLGLGAGIDYALLIVGRYREQLAAGETSAMRRACQRTAGTRVLAAGAIVAVAIAGLLGPASPSSAAWAWPPPWWSPPSRSAP